MTYRTLLATLLAIAPAACGDNLTAPAAPDAAPVTPQPDAPAGFVPTPFGNAPQLIDVGGGVLVHPKIQPIFFANDATMQASIEDFLAQLATSSYWTTAASEYGVKAPTILPTIVTTDAPPTTETNLVTWMKGHLDGTHTAAGFPATVDPDTIYSLFLPNGAQITGPDGNSCQAYGAFHDEITGAHGESIVYALMPRCGHSNQLDSLTVSFSHELLEAATDPRVETTPGFGDADPEHYVWAYTPGAENGDWCEYIDNGSKLVGNYAVQRTWSNAAAKAGHDPCVPAPATPYMAAAPVMPDSMSIPSILNGNVTTKGIAVPLHGSKTIDLTIFSDAESPDLTVAAFDLAGQTPELTFAFDKTNVHNE